MIRQAVIMAGGLGSRLKEKTESMPKGFIELGEIPIVERSIQKLISSGIEEIIIGTGHCSEWYEKLKLRYPVIKLAHNSKYSQTGSMGTLSCCAPLVNGDFLLLESDLVYDISGFFVLINETHKNIILASGETHSGDEVYLETDADGYLIKHSKKRDAILNLAGELTGITRLTKETLGKMVSYMLENLNSQPMMEYETAMSYVSLSSEINNKIFVIKIDNFLWCEIDDASHLENAKKNIYPKIIESENKNKVRREVLLNPGPATTTDSVKYAQVCPDICPREKDFGGIMSWVAEELALFAGNKDTIETVLFGGSGTAADEAMISSCVPDSGKLLIVDNGAYGERMSKMAEVYRLNFEVYESSGFLPLNTEKVKEILIKGKFTHLAIVYHETTTGLLNPVPELGKFCQEHGIVTIVDAVSAYAAIPIDMNRDGIDFMASTSNKNIQGMAGIALVFCRKEALNNIKAYPMRNFYLNIWDQYEYFKKTNQTRFTPPVQAFYSLRQAIIEAKIETIQGRYTRYSSCWEELFKSIKRLNLEMLVPEEHQSKLITAVIEPSSSKYNFNDFHNFARAYGFTIYPGKLSNTDTFRIANIGDIQVHEMKYFTSLMEEYMRTVLNK